MQSADSPRQIAQTLPRGAKNFLAADRRFLFASGKNIGIMILYENLGFCACAQDVEIFKKRGSYDMIPHGKEIKVFTGSSNPDLADMICKNLGISLGKSTVTAFADGECSISINEPVRGADVFIVQSTCKPVNDNLMELLVMIDAMQPRLRRPHHRRHPVLRLCPAGPQGQEPRPHLRQARGQPHHRRRRRPRADDGPARRADPGLL